MYLERVGDDDSWVRGWGEGPRQNKMSLWGFQWRHRMQKGRQETAQFLALTSSQRPSCLGLRFGVLVLAGVKAVGVHGLHLLSS